MIYRDNAIYGKTLWFWYVILNCILFCVFIYSELILALYIITCDIVPGKKSTGKKSNISKLSQNDTCF